MKKTSKKKSRANNTEIKNIHTDIYRICAVAFFFCVGIVLPLYYENAYFDMLEAKAHCYMVFAIVLLPILFVGICCQIKEEGRKNLFRGMEPLDWCVLIFGCYTILSCLCSESFYYSFFGILGWSVGGFLMCSVCIIYQVVSRYLDYRQKLWIPVFVVNIFIFVVAVLHSCRIDVLSMHVGIDPYYYFMYLSTIGQQNGFATYLSMLVPLTAVFYLSSKDLFFKRLCMAVFFLESMCIILCQSDGVYLGLGSCAFFAIPYVLGSLERLERFFHLVTVYGLAVLFLILVPSFDEKLGLMDGLAAEMASLKIVLPILLVGVAGWLFIKKCGTVLTEARRRRLAVVLEVAMVLATVALVVMAGLSFDDEWGNNRGAIWRMSAEVYQNFSVKQKLFGVGPEMLRPYYDEISNYFGMATLTSHCEIFQVLLTMGWLGVAAWLAVWVCVFRTFFKHKIWKEDSIALFLPLAAYFGQNFVNSPRAQEYVIFYLMMCCYQRVLRMKKEH